MPTLNLRGCTLLGVLLLMFANGLNGKKQNRLGPGSGAWEHAPAASVGLNAHAVANAAIQYGKLASPTCLVVVRDGVVVLDEHYGDWGKGGRSRLHLLAIPSEPASVCVACVRAGGRACAGKGGWSPFDGHAHTPLY